MAAGGAVPATPAAPAARIARRHLAAAVAAARQLKSRITDDEALHDFRVALRRLRSTLRLYPEVFTDEPRKKWRRRLKRLAGSTNAARDADVQLDLLAAYRDSTAVAAVRTAIVAERTRVHREIESRVLPDFLALAPRVDAALRRIERRGDPEAGLRIHAGRRALVLIDQLAGQLAGLSGPEDHAGVHAARITGKRLRYLLEPWGEESAVAPVVQRLKKFQDDSGELCDRHVLLARVSAGLADAIRGRALTATRARPAERSWTLLAQQLGRDIVRRDRALRRDYAAARTPWLTPARALARRWAATATAGTRATAGNRRGRAPT